MVRFPCLIHFLDHLPCLPGIHTQYIYTVFQTLLLTCINIDPDTIFMLFQDGICTSAHNNTILSVGNILNNILLNIENVILYHSCLG